MKNTFDRGWWEEKWEERERTLVDAFGETSPPDTVIGCTWANLTLRVPGACTMVFPPDDRRQSHWLVITHGLTQPISKMNDENAKDQSGYGYEFGFLVPRREEWPATALFQLMLYVSRRENWIGRGHRIPMWFSYSADGVIIPQVGVIRTQSPNCYGDMRWLLFWPLMSCPSGFSTSTGFFGILVATTITQFEWEMAREASTSHLLLLLFMAGVGQASDLDRKCLFEQERWTAEWRTLRALSVEVAEDRLLDITENLRV